MTWFSTVESPVAGWPASFGLLPICQDCCFAFHGPGRTPLGPVPTLSELGPEHEELRRFLIEGPGLFCYLCRNVASPASWMSLWVPDG